ncbi:MAG: hypothetical protein LVR00_00480 [Rhabdochlamydiaceae bacterium]
MPKLISNKILESILDVVIRFPEGASLTDISQTLKSPVPRRSLQRYLAFLSREGKLSTLGKARSRRYLLPLIVNEVIPAFPLRDSYRRQSNSSIFSSFIHSGKCV